MPYNIFIVLPLDESSTILPTFKRTILQNPLTHWHRKNISGRIIHRGGRDEIFAALSRNISAVIPRTSSCRIKMRPTNVYHLRAKFLTSKSFWMAWASHQSLNLAGEFQLMKWGCLEVVFISHFIIGLILSYLYNVWFSPIVVFPSPRCLFLVNWMYFCRWNCSVNRSKSLYSQK